MRLDLSGMISTHWHLVIPPRPVPSHSYPRHRAQRRTVTATIYQATEEPVLVLQQCTWSIVLDLRRTNQNQTIAFKTQI